MTGTEIVDLLKTKIKPHWKSLSIDGSSFDSSQFAILMDSVDNNFWRRMRPFIRKIVEHNWNLFPVTPLVSKETITENLMRSLLSTKNIVFVEVPTVNAPEWPEHIRR